MQPTLVAWWLQCFNDPESELSCILFCSTPVASIWSAATVTSRVTHSRGHREWRLAARLISSKSPALPKCNQIKISRPNNQPVWGSRVVYSVNQKQMMSLSNNRYKQALLCLLIIRRDLLRTKNNCVKHWYQLESMQLYFISTPHQIFAELEASVHESTAQ